MIADFFFYVTVPLNIAFEAKSDLLVSKNNLQGNIWVILFADRITLPFLFFLRPEHAFDDKFAKNLAGILQ